MSLESAREYLKQYGMDDRVRQMDQGTETVAAAARTLGCEEGQIAKSLAFKGNDDPILVVAMGRAKVDNRKFKETFGLKAKMLSWDETASLIGHEPGGVCPFGVNEGVHICLDESLKQYKEVYPAAGSDNSCLLLSIEELEKVLPQAQWVDVCKIPE